MSDELLPGLRDELLCAADRRYLRRTRRLVAVAVVLAVLSITLWATR